MRTFLHIIKIFALCVSALISAALLLFICPRNIEETKPHGETFYGCETTGTIQLYTSATEFYDTLASRISSAKDSVYIEMYTFDSDSCGHLIMDRLVSKAGEEVPVKLRLDGYGSRSMWNADSLRALNVDIGWTDELKFPFLNHIKSRDHRKVAIIDGWGSVGCTNIQNIYVKGDATVGDWYDMSVGAKAGDKDIRIIYQKEEFKRNLIEVLKNAQDSVRICQPYIALTQEIEDEIFRAMERGVRFQFLLSEVGDIPAYMYSSYGFLKRASEAGAVPYIFKGGFHHTKAVSVDGKYLLIGSYNFSRRTLCWNEEADVLISDPGIVEKYNRSFEEYKESSRILTEEYWDSLPATFRIKSRIFDKLNFLIIE